MIETLINKITQLPGVGPKSAKRIVLHLLVNKNGLMQGIIKLMESVLNLVKTCNKCGNLDVCNPCNICADPNRDNSLMCLVKGVSDLWALERAGVYKGLYYVVGEDVTSASQKLKQLRNKVAGEEANLKEIIVAIGATLEDQIATHYLQKVLQDSNVLITTLACGIPVGAEIDYIDEGTLTIALQSRQKL